eukprot:5483457-Amphidinium_carterae.1
MFITSGPAAERVCLKPTANSEDCTGKDIYDTSRGSVRGSNVIDKSMESISPMMSGAESKSKWVCQIN